MFKKILSIDLDGVIIDSLDNMKVAWKHTNQKFSLNISFTNYSRYLGLPFREILKKNHIYIKHEEIYKNYNKISLKNYKLIKVYKNIIKVLNILKKRYIIIINTSKNRLRAQKILKLKNIPYNRLIAPEDVLRGKPFNDSVLYIKKKYHIKNKDIIHVGDFEIDYKFAKNSKIKFIFANWGYGKKVGKLIANKPKDLVKMVNKILR